MQELISPTSEFEQFHQNEKIGIIIGIYGEKDSILSLLERIPVDLVDTVCIIVDVPQKQLMNRVRAAAGECGVTVHIIKNEVRGGAGHAIRQGLHYLMDTNHTIAVLMAGNGKDDPREIPRLLVPVVRNQYDYVQGSRYIHGGIRKGMPFVRQVFNRLYPAIWTITTGKKCTDVTNGYRCYRLDLLKDARINLSQKWLDGYSMEYYLHYKVLALGYRFKEVPVSKTYAFRNRGGYSKIQPLKDWWPIISPLLLLASGVRE